MSKSGVHPDVELDQVRLPKNDWSPKELRIWCNPMEEFPVPSDSKETSDFIQV